MTLEIAFVLFLVLLSIFLFTTEKYPIDMVALIMMATLLVSGVISPEEGISGFGNTATATVAAMFVISAGLFKTGALNIIASGLEKLASKSFFLALVAMMLVVGFLSAFVNNTATVAIFMPIVLGVARVAQVSPSKFLMPLSFASMFGGVCTLIGTSTNILVNSISEREGLGSFGMFEFLPLGLIIFGVGFFYMLLIGVRLLPNVAVVDDLTDKFGMGDYLTEIILLQEAKSVGQSLKDCSLVQDLDIEVLEVSREGRRLVLPSEDVILQSYDVLRVRAKLTEIREIQEREGIVIKAGLKWQDKDFESEQVVLGEAVIAPHSLLVGRSLQDIGFRNRFGASVLAIRHSGAIRHEKLGTTLLRGGDALLIEVRRESLASLKRHPAFVFINEVETPIFRKQKVLPALGILLGVVLSSALGLLPVVSNAIVGSVLLILTGCLTLEEAYEAIDWKVIFLLAGMMTLGVALETTGAATLTATYFSDILGQWGPRVLLSALFLLTTVLTNMMSNTATAALLAPVAIVLAQAQGWNARPFLMAVMFGASLSFMTPVGYQTNTLVYGPGQYRFSDFMRVGTPLNVIFWLICTALIPVFWPF